MGGGGGGGGREGGLDLSPHSADFEAWFSLGGTSAVELLAAGLADKSDLVRLASSGYHLGFSKTLAELDPAVRAHRIAVRNSLMIFAMLDDHLGAALIVADARFRPPYHMCRSYSSLTGKIGYFKWALQEMNKRWTYQVCRDVGSHGKAAVLKCLGESGLKIREVLFSCAIIADNRTAIEWYLAEGHPPSRSACQVAMQCGKVDTLRYLLARNVPLYPVDVPRACNSTTAMLDELESCRFDMAKDTCAMCNAAAKYGNLATLKWCRVRDFPWNSFTFIEALNSTYPNSAEVLHYLWEMNCPRPEQSKICETLFHNCNLSHIEWYCEAYPTVASWFLPL